MTLEDALAEPGRKVQTSRETTDGQRLVTISRVDDHGATRLAEAALSLAEHDALVATLSARGGELADTEFLTNILWVIKPDGVEVYDQRRQQFAAAGDRATIKDGRIIARADVARVFSWAAAAYSHRGIKAALRSGEDVELVIEIALATGDPTYNRNDLLADSGWCTTLGRAIARWAGVAFEDRI
jgi:hypothetical protein